jgi:lipoprotein-releasing system ATP-binding protein
MSADKPPLVELHGVRKAFGQGDARVEVLHGIDLTVHEGELVSLIGPSGCGKSTLLNLLGLLDRATSGTLRIRGRDVADLNDAALTRLRGETLGFVFQFHHLLTGLSVVENVMLPAASLQGGLHRRQRARAEELLGYVGLTGQADRKSRDLSGGMQQRVAVARALMNAPAIVFADEPTGNLDTESSDQVMRLLLDWNQRHGTTFIIVTHDHGIARKCRRVLRMVDGNLVADGSPEDVLDA